MAGFKCDRCGAVAGSHQSGLHSGCGGYFTIPIAGITAVQVETHRPVATQDFIGLVQSQAFSSLKAPQIEPLPQRAQASPLKAAATLSDVISMLEPLSSPQRAQVLAAVGAWFAEVA